jgi:aryl-alcohol dehydrogenase-like predicted oxidoreductase
VGLRSLSITGSCTYSAEPGTPSEDALKMLASWAATTTTNSRSATPSRPPHTEETGTDGQRTTGRDGAKDQPARAGMHELRESHHPNAHTWALDDDAAQPFFRPAIEMGVTFWDTANVYQAGTSEEVVGRAIKCYARREDIILATKVHGKMHDGPGGQGLSRKAILEQVDASLARLGTDYIDLCQIHRVDPETPVEETMEALHDIVKAGKVRYLGASSMYAWQFAKLQPRRRATQLDPIRRDAEPVQPASTTRRAGAASHVR